MKVTPLELRYLQGQANIVLGVPIRKTIKVPSCLAFFSNPSVPIKITDFKKFKLGANRMTVLASYQKH